MDINELESFVDILYPYILKKFKESSDFRSTCKMKNACVSEVKDDGTIDVKFPYDDTTVNVINETGCTLSEGDTVCLLYWIDLKNSIAIHKV